MSTEQDLTTIDGVKALMQSSTSESNWNENCDKVKKANGGYPSFWYGEIILSGLMSRTTSNWN